jgi:hypothetical protein
MPSTTTQPYAGQRYGYIRIPGVDTVATRQEVYYTPVTPDYFRTTGARLVEGRGFAATDGAGAAPVTVITESLAELLWPGEGAVGRCIRTEPGANAPCREIIGVTEDVRYARVIGAPTLMFYLPMSQAPPSGNWRGLLVRFHGDPENGLPTVRRVMQTMEPGMPYVQGELLETRIAPELLPWRLGAVMFTAFGALALLLASLGLYSVVSYDIAQRRRELGVRVALGARAPNVLRLIVWDAVGVVGAGLLLGVVLAVLGARWIEPLLYDAPGFEPGVFGWVAAMLLTVAVVAAGIPGLRAARVHPTEALREE